MSGRARWFFGNGGKFTEEQRLRKSIAEGLSYCSGNAFFWGGGKIQLDEQSLIMVPKKPSEQDLFLGRFLTAELSDRYGVAGKEETSLAREAGGIDP